MVRYDEADKIMFDIVKDDWNDYGPNSNASIRIPTLRTLPTYLEKLKGNLICCVKQHAIQLIIRICFRFAARESLGRDR